MVMDISLRQVKPLLDLELSLHTMQLVTPRGSTITPTQVWHIQPQEHLLEFLKIQTMQLWSLRTDFPLLILVMKVLSVMMAHQQLHPLLLLLHHQVHPLHPLQQPLKALQANVEIVCSPSFTTTEYMIDVQLLMEIQNHGAPLLQLILVVGSTVKTLFVQDYLLPPQNKWQ